MVPAISFLSLEEDGWLSFGVPSQLAFYIMTHKKAASFIEAIFIPMPS
jgi:hypothetical protein